jgi:tetratricopeptide (TPR) repeat protein
MLTGAKLEALLAKLKRALDDRGDAEAAEKVFREVMAEAQKLGLVSAYVHYVLSGLLDRMGKLEMAFDEIKKAARADPLALPVRPWTWRHVFAPRWQIRPGPRTTPTSRVSTRCSWRRGRPISRHTS